MPSKTWLWLSDLGDFKEIYLRKLKPNLLILQECCWPRLSEDFGHVSKIKQSKNRCPLMKGSQHPENPRHYCYTVV